MATEAVMDSYLLCVNQKTELSKVRRTKVGARTSIKEITVRLGRAGMHNAAFTVVACRTWIGSGTGRTCVAFQ